jgi:hypothetical protein
MASGFLAKAPSGSVNTSALNVNDYLDLDLFLKNFSKIRQHRLFRH